MTVKTLSPTLLAILIILIAISSGCEVSEDPYSDLAMGQAMQEKGQELESAARISIMSTQAALAALETQSSLDAIQETRIALRTQDAMAYKSTEIAKEYEYVATATQRSYDATATIQSVISTSFAQSTQIAATAVVASRKQQSAVVSHYSGLVLRVVATLALVVSIVGILAIVWSNRKYVGGILEALELKTRMYVRGPNDAPLIFFRIGDGRILAWDPDRNVAPGAVVSSSGACLSGMHPDMTAQMAVTYQDQVIDLARAMPTARQAQPQKVSPPIQEAAISSPMRISLPAPEWNLLSSMSKGKLVLGIGDEGPILADPETFPHWLIAGTTGSGKTRYGLRPLIASAILDGFNVLVIDKSGLDFLPFKHHPSVRLALVDTVQDVISYLEAAYALIRNRQDYLASVGISTWGRLDNPPAPRVLIVIDEYSNLVDSAENNAERDSMLRYSRMVAAEGRKAGVHLAIALQDPTYKSVDPRIRRNAAPVTFRVRDDTASRVIIGAGGAESLEQGQFMALLGTSVIKGSAFNPDDQEIVDTIESEGIMFDASWMPAGYTNSPVEEETIHGCTRDQVTQILDLYSAGSSQSKIEQTVFGHSGGSSFRKVKAVIADPLSYDFANSTTTAQITTSEVE